MKIQPFTDILYQARDGVATLTLNRPDKMNAFRGQTISELTEGLALALKERSVGVIVITGSGSKAFSVGGDISEMSTLNQKTGKLFVAKLGRLTKRLLTSPKPIIARINGYCLGGGNEIQIFCDITVASDRSLIGQVGPKVGNAPLWGGTQILPLLVGIKRACEITFVNKQYPAREAAEIGLINFCVPEAELDKTVADLCQELLNRSPQALRLARKSLYDGLLPRIQRGLKDLEKLYGSPEATEGMSAFLEKRPANWKQFRM
ncbi:MAG: enoyl-CoA hydratase/isomerase family protein [Deltaproteobacteria bacterium]|nr:enoyl-CoA hydratase/isomerase family protein [Deltaproteobacteria bacterium]